MPDSLWAHGLQHARLPYHSLSLRVCSNSCPLNQWCHLTISSFAALFSFCLKSFPAAGSFPISWLLTAGAQTIWASASASVLPMNIQGWFLLGLTGLMSFQSKGLSRVFSSTTVWSALSRLYGLYRLPWQDPIRSQKAREPGVLFPRVSLQGHKQDGEIEMVDMEATWKFSSTWPEINV